MIVPPRCLTLVRQLNLAATPSRGAGRKTGIRFQGPNPLELTELLAAGAEERTRTSTGLPPPDPESGVSTNSTTSARCQSGGRCTGCHSASQGDRWHLAATGWHRCRIRKRGVGVPNPSEPRRRILVVDDEEGFRDGVADLLSMEGYAVSVARNAVEAVPMLPDFRPDVILLDLRMPLLDGEAFLRGIRGLPASRDVPVVLISAKEELPAIATRYGAAGYLSKPFEAPQLLSLIERVLA